MQNAIATLADAGFDLVHAFDAGAIARAPGLAWVADGEAAQLGLLVGNTRALWPHFVAAMRDPALAAEADPLDRYTERAIDRAIASERWSDARVRHAHAQYDGAFLPFQQLAVATGLGAWAPSRLVIHPVYGPWFALRSLIVVAGAPVARAPIAKPCACAEACDVALRAALADNHWRKWLAVRDACALRSWRYGDDQIVYHYTKRWPTDRD
ncbi:MAG TPA: hypothetical protein VFQ53_21040 [Kofleriaceae bacterium]|nr:hypothetical protein [Kofleriaceae bacterium]